MAIMSTKPAQSAAVTVVPSQSTVSTIALAGSAVPSKLPRTDPTIATP